MGGLRRGWVVFVPLVLLWGGQPNGEPAPPIRAAYFYHYMGAVHLDSLGLHGFDRAVIHWIPDSLGARGAIELSAYLARGLVLGIEVVPQWALQAPSRVAARPATRRYTWGGGRTEAEVACPCDSLYWRSALLDRADEFLLARPGVTRLAVDLEFYRGSRHHYDAGPCRCPDCLAEYRGGGAAASDVPPATVDLLGWEEARIERMLSGLLAELAARYPGVELGVFDLDLDSFVHRALARALAKSSVRTVDYCERSYGSAGAALPAARTRLDALGLAGAPLLGGLWLKRFAPPDVAQAVRSLESAGAGYFVFTTYSLWLDPARLSGPYTLLGSQSDYWSALGAANRAP